LRKSLRNSQVPKDLTHLGCMGETSYKEDANTDKQVEERATQTVDEKWTVGNMATTEMTQMIKVVIDGNRLKNRC
jgi:hypothetical protein